METKDFQARQPVVYVPSHAQEIILSKNQCRGSLKFEGTQREIIQAMLDESLRRAEDTLPGYEREFGDGVEFGVVSSFNDQFVFVKYHPSLYQTGWGITSQATSPDDLFTRSNVAEDRGHAMSPNTHWIVSEHRVSTGLLDEAIKHVVHTVVDGEKQRYSKKGLAYLDCRDIVLYWAKPEDTCIEKDLDGRSTELYLVVIEDHELGTVRLAARDGSDG